jgi:hypothetical protein
MKTPRAFEIARNLVHNLKNNTNWVHPGTTIDEPERPQYSEPSQTGCYFFTFADTHTRRLFKVAVTEIDIRGQPINRIDGK